jgi:tetratricopeptide (TPR) repeat protein
LELNPESVELHMLLARIGNDIGDGSLAFTHAQAVIDLEPDNSEAWAIMGICYYVKGDWDNVCEVLNTLMMIEDFTAKTCLQAGFLALEMLEFTSAERFFTQAIDLEPRHAEAKIGLAKCLIVEGDYMQAETLYQDTLKVNEKYLSARVGMAELAVLRGDKIKAIADYQDVLKQPDAKVTHHLRLAELYMQTGKSEKSAVVLEAALLITPDDRNLHLALAEVYLKHQLYSKAIRQAEAVTKLNHNHPGALRILVNVYLAQGQWDKAVGALRLYVRGNSQDVEMQLTLANAYLKLGWTSEAFVKLQELISQYSYNAAIILKLGEYYYQTSDLNNAEKQFRQALMIVPHDPKARLNLALVLMEQGKNLDEANQMAKQLAREMPNNPLTLNLYGWTLLARNDPQQARSMFMLSSKINPRIPATWYWLGKTFMALNERDNASASLQKSLLLSDSFKNANDARKLLNELK